MPSFRLISLTFSMSLIMLWITLVEKPVSRRRRLSTSLVVQGGSSVAMSRIFPGISRLSWVALVMGVSKVCQLFKYIVNQRGMCVCVVCLPEKAWWRTPPCNPPKENQSSSLSTRPDRCSHTHHTHRHPCETGVKRTMQANHNGLTKTHTQLT